MFNDHIDRYCVNPGVSKATKVFEQRGDTCFINQVKSFIQMLHSGETLHYMFHNCQIWDVTSQDEGETLQFYLYYVQPFDDEVPDKRNGHYRSNLEIQQVFKSMFSKRKKTLKECKTALTLRTLLKSFFVLTSL